LFFDFLKPSQRRRKGKAAENEVYDILFGDGLKVHKVDASGAGKREKGDISLLFQGNRYSVEVKRQEKLPLSGLNRMMGESDVLVLRGNRQEWSVYMTLATLEMLLLNEK
jgi:Holliday junction resolvase